MDESVGIPGDPPIEAVVITRRDVSRSGNPRLRFVDKVVLKQSTRQIKTATHWEIINEHTGELHHHEVKLESIPRATKAKGGNWDVDSTTTFNLSNDKVDEIGALRGFLVALEGLPESEGRYALVRIDDPNARGLWELLQNPSTSGKATVLVNALEAVGGDAEALWDLARLSLDHPEISQLAAAALNFATYSQAVDELSALIDGNAAERAFQVHLSSHPWMFGSEYSELLDRRNWVRDHQKDFMLRRTVDGYLEIVEIKTTLGGTPLFRFDESHHCYYARSELSQVVGQVQTYIEEVDADRNAIERRDQEKVSKIRAKVIIGRDTDEMQIAALRRFNSHLIRIEVMTFDQLLRISRHVTDRLARAITPAAGEDSILEEMEFSEVPF